MKCPKCGSQITEGYRYVTCPDCGYTFDTHSITNEVETTAISNNKTEIDAPTSVIEESINDSYKYEEPAKDSNVNFVLVPDDKNSKPASKVKAVKATNKNTEIPPKESEEKPMNSDLRPDNNQSSDNQNAVTNNAAKKQFYNEWWFWLIVAALAVGIVFLLKGGITKSPSEQITNSGESDVATATNAITAPAKTFDPEKVSKQLEVKQYTYNNRYDHGVVLVIKNNSEFTLDLDCNTTFYASDSMIGTAEDYLEDLPSGHEVAIEFRNDAAFERYEYVINAKATEYYKPVAQNLVIENQNIAGDKVVFALKNNGDINVESADVMALFFKGDTLVDVDSTYISDLAPGQSVNKEANSWIDDGFDTVLLYVEARSDYIS